MGCCLGGFAKSPTTSDGALWTTTRKEIGQSSGTRKRQWPSSLEPMESSVSISHSLETHLSAGPATANEGKKSVEENCSFVNNAAMAWNQSRKEWIGDQSVKSHRAPREPIISWCTTYEDLLLTSQPFPQPIPLSEMIDFLVDIWHEEGLYD